MPSGLTYQVWHRSPGGIPAASGATVKFRYLEKHGDSAYDGTGGRMPAYQALMPGLLMPYTPGETLRGARAGDSIAYVRRVDSLLAKGLFRALPPGWKRSDELSGSILVEKVFPFDPVHGDSILLADKLAEARQLLTKVSGEGQERMKKWLVAEGIPAAPDAGGVYMVIDESGSGTVVDSGMTVGVRYRIKTLAGKLINSNMDSSFHHPPVLQVTIGRGMLPRVEDHILRGLRRGSKLRVFVPRGAGMDAAAVVRVGAVPPDGLVWDLEIE